MTEKGKIMNWRKSSRSASNGACVEVAFVAGCVLVRDSKQKDGPVLRFTVAEWRAFTAGVLAGEFDLDGEVAR